ncbi:nicotinamide riboside kinase-like protein 2 [Plenodomus tracheiphilus IPT5]|uniref:Nicotinamide riboside kinase-like protein 2 n=1 Tax=Plenodomus tracheiphilus IPT5 TaxID=1408161 RepID=A0A6A7AWK7_9PLEO|nr:nicotinamide riboside kinase-like protein 2 [Plenodomus tracheiphilus IPT5]
MQPPLLIAISGPSSSGKTTLARLLRDIFPPSKLFILHLDDFYLTDAEIPIKNGLRDWDCLESLDLAGLVKALRDIKQYGKSPDWLISKEDQNSVGEHGVPETEIVRLRTRVNGLLQARPDWEDRRICIVDGFLLFSEDMQHIRSLFDLRLFLRTSYEIARKRREARSGYVTLEGFWEDPPGYVDKIVWPNYVKDHKFLFEGGNVEGPLDSDTCGRVGIHGMPRDAEDNMAKCLVWAVEELEDVLKSS